MLVNVKVNAEDDGRLSSQALIVGQNQDLAVPINRITKEIMNPDTNTLIKSDLSDAELIPFVIGDSFTKTVGCPFHRLVLDSLLVAKMSHKRQRVKEILNLVNPGSSNQKKSWKDWLFGR